MKKFATTLINTKNKKPVSFDDFLIFLKDNVTNLKLNNQEILIEKYNIYKEFFYIYKPSKRYSLKVLGFDSINDGKKYYLSRGWTLEEFYKEKNKQTTKGRITLLLNPDYEKIKKKYGLSSRVENYIKKKNPLTNKLYTENEAKDFISKKQRHAANIRADKERRGIIKPKYNSYKTLFEKGLTYEEANALFYEKNVFSLEKCIKKYGEVNGTNKWKQRQIKWQKILSNKPIEERKIILEKKIRNSGFYSQQSIIFFEKLIRVLKVEEKINFTFQWKNKERFIYDEKINKFFKYDFYIKEINMIIEFNGHRYHPNKKLLSEKEFKEWKSIRGVNSKEAYEKDELKKEVALKHNYLYEVIWTDLNLMEQFKKLKKIIINEFNKKRNT